MVTAVEIREKDASDTKLLPDLVKTTAKHFDMREVSADKGYASVNNTNVIASHGATPYIAFKSIHSGAAGGLWEKMFHYSTMLKIQNYAALTGSRVTRYPSRSIRCVSRSTRCSRRRSSK